MSDNTTKEQYRHNLERKTHNGNKIQEHDKEEEKDKKVRKR